MVEYWVADTGASFPMAIAETLPFLIYEVLIFSVVIPYSEFTAHTSISCLPAA